MKYIPVIQDSILESVKKIREICPAFHLSFQAASLHKRICLLAVAELILQLLDCGLLPFPDSSRRHTARPRDVRIR